MSKIEFVLDEDNFDGNDDHISALKEMVEEIDGEMEAARKTLGEYHDLHDLLSDMIESGRLRESDIPKDYAALVAALASIGSDRHANE